MSYTSRSLSDVETRYSQTEREALAAVWGCEHFDRFINGAPKVTVITDHKPLENIWKKPKPHLRIERWGLRLQPYKVQIMYRPGSGNPADYMSQHPPRSRLKSSHEQQMADHYVNLVTRVATPSALTEV